MSWKPLDVTKEDIAVAMRQFQKKARFLVDESLGVQTAKFIRERGWNVEDFSEVGLQGRPDEDVLAYAFREKRILLTHDTDFLDDRRFPPHRTPGVVVLPGASGQQEPLVRALLDLLWLIGPYAKVYEGAKMQLSPDRIFSCRHRHADGVLRTTRYRYGGSGPALIWVDESKETERKANGSQKRQRFAKTQKGSGK